MRTLTLDEVGFVSGGDDEPMQEVVVRAKRIIDGPLRYYLSEDTGGGRFAGDGGSGAGGDDNLEEVVVEAPKMTEQEKLAYDAAKARAEATLVAMEAAGVGIAAWVAAQSSAVQKGILAALGFIAGYKYMQGREALLEKMTEYEFRLDGMDGVYDGIVDEKYRHNI